MAIHDNCIFYFKRLPRRPLSRPCSLPPLPFGFLRHQNLFLPVLFPSRLCPLLSVCQTIFMSSCLSHFLRIHPSFALDILNRSNLSICQPLSGRSKARHPPDSVTCSHPASSDSTFVSLLVVPSQQFFRAMLSLFFRCKFSASGVRQVPLCSTIDSTTLFLHKFFGSLPHFLAGRPRPKENGVFHKIYW